jgi:D-alanine-D-alanine ligase
MMENQKYQIGVLFGGRSSEHEVSLMSARSVLDAIDLDKYAITQIGITHDGSWLAGEDALDSMLNGQTHHLTPVTLFPDPTHHGLYAIGDGKYQQYAKIDVYFPVLHGTYGEDGTLQGLFEMAEVAYVGAGVLGAAVGMDKAIFKDIMIAQNIPVVDGFVVSKNQLQTDIEFILDKVEKFAPYPIFTKPANMGSSVGVTKCRSRSDLYEGLIEAACYDRRVMIERGINAREIEISVLGNENPQASIPGEISPEADFYSYDAKYHDDKSQLYIPAPIPNETAEQMREMAVSAYRAIDCAGMARVDFLLDRDSGAFYINEVNTIPGFTQISMYPKLWEASGLPYSELIERLIALALGRRRERSQIELRYQR